MYRYIYRRLNENSLEERKRKKILLTPFDALQSGKGDRHTHTHAVSKSYFSKEEKRLDIFILLLIHTRVYFPLCTYYTLALSSRDNLLGAQTIRMKIGKKKEREKKKKRPRFEIFVRKIYLLYTSMPVLRHLLSRLQRKFENCCS